MANKIKGEVDFHVNGDTVYTLVYTINAICELEDHLGASLQSVMARFERGEWDFRLLRDVFWAGLLTNHRMDRTAAGDLMTAVGIPSAMEKVTESLQRSFPDMVKGGDETPGKPGGGTGTTS